MTLEEKWKINSDKIRFLKKELQDVRDLLREAEEEKRQLEKEWEDRVQGKLWQEK